MSSESREFRMSPALLWKVIHDQAGTISKAILEGAMNSVDAGATYCDITIEGNKFSIKDDGKGFKDENEISRFFESFGEEHVEGDAVYGRFRMGRGQIMAFGHNKWRTGEFLMDVNLKPQGSQKRDENFTLGYDFTKGLPRSPGCSIGVDLYPENHLKPSELNSMVDEIERYVKYIDIPVTVNGKIVSMDPANQKWDIINDDAYIKLKETGGVTIYNLGSLVKSGNSWQHGGLSGVVVSRKQLKVNFARNDVQSDCKVWRRIQSELKNESKSNVQKNKPLNDATRMFYARELVSGELSLKDAEKMRLITDVTNSHHPMTAITRMKDVAAAKRSDKVGETAHTRKLAFVVSHDCLERFGADDIFEFEKIMKDIYKKNGRITALNALNPIDAKEFEKIISSSHIPLQKNELNKFEKICVGLANEMSKNMWQQGDFTDRNTNLDVFSNSKPRVVHAGKSETALAWTDGTTNIWFEVDYLRKKMREGYKGILEIANTMLHEYIHREADTASHDHGIEFYEAYHEYTVRTEVVSRIVDMTMSRIIQQARKENTPIKKLMLDHMDRVEGASKVGIGNYDEFLNAEKVDDPEEEAQLIFNEMDNEPRTSDEKGDAPKLKGFG